MNVNVKVKFIISLSHCKLYLNIQSYYNALEKIEWGDIPHETYVKDKDILGKWIKCDIEMPKSILDLNFASQNGTHTA